MADIKSFKVYGKSVLMRRVSETIYEVVDGGDTGIPKKSHVLIDASILRQQLNVAGEVLEIFPESAIIGIVELKEDVEEVKEENGV